MSTDEFREWVRETKPELRRRIEVLSDPKLPEQRARESLEELREYAVRPLDEDFEQEILKRALPAATKEITEARDAAERELRFFQHGPIAWSLTRRPKFKTGVEGMKRSRPQTTARDHWENRFLATIVVDSVNALHAYFETPEDDPLPEDVDPASLPIYVEASMRGLRRLGAVSAIVLLMLREGEITRDRMMEAHREAYALLETAEAWTKEVEPHKHHWGKERLRAFEVVSEVLDMNRASVEKHYTAWKSAT